MNWHSRVVVIGRLQRWGLPHPIQLQLTEFEAVLMQPALGSILCPAAPAKSQPDMSELLMLEEIAQLPSEP